MYEKLRWRGTSELALVQRITPRRVKQAWQAYRRDNAIPDLKKLGRPEKASISLQDAAIILEAYDRLRVNALTLESALKHSHELNLVRSRIHMILKKNGKTRA